jgi:flagellar motor switch protein FliM
MPDDRVARDLPVEVTCELARVTMTAREILELRPGSTISLAKAVDTAVDLVAGGRVIARGELVDLEGQLGVRISSLT